jgi:hypothetical protein
MKFYKQKWCCNIYLHGYEPLSRGHQFCSYKKFSTFYGTRKFITVFTRAFPWSISSARPIQPTPPHRISQRTTHLRSGLPSGLFPSGFPTITFIHSASPHLCCTPYQSHPPCLEHPNYICRRVLLLKLLNISSLLSLHLSSAPHISSAPCSQTS